jgi:hypothetical protein
MKFKAMGLLVLTLAVFSGCSYKKNNTTNVGWEQKINSEEASRLVTTYSAMQWRENKLFLEDSKVIYDDSIQHIILEYTTMNIMTFCEVRLMTVEFVDGFLDWLNNHPVLSTQLGHYPFTADNLSLSILFKNFYAEYVDPLYVGLVIMEDGVVTYYASDIKDQWADWSHQRIEPYFKSRELAYIKEEADQLYPPTETGRPNLKNDVLIAVPQGKTTGAGAVVPRALTSTPVVKKEIKAPAAAKPASRSTSGFTSLPAGATNAPSGATTTPAGAATVPR